MTDDQREWVEKQNMLLHVSVERTVEQPKRAWRRYLFRAATSDAFNGFIMFVIGISVVSQAITCVGCPTCPPPPWVVTAGQV